MAEKVRKRVLERLTATAVEKKKWLPGRHADGGGLYLQIGPTGTKSWIFRYKRAGKTREMGLGPLQTRRLKEARARARECREILLAGIDPIEARNARRAENARSLSFKESAQAYIEGHRATWTNAKHTAQWKNTLETYCYPEIGSTLVSKLDTGHVLEVLEPIWTTKAETASRLRGRIEKILDWATVRGFREGPNPARWRGHLDQTLPKRSKVSKVEHHAALPFDETPAFLVKLRKQPGVAPRALEFAILAAARTNEVIGAMWSEIDLKACTWTVPAGRTKAKREHKVPLSPRAVEILEEMDARRDGDFVFPGWRRRRPLSNMAMLKVLERMKRDDLTVHGFRSTFRDWAAERTTFQNHIVEMALAHAIGSKVEEAYRRGDLFDKRRELMDAWALHCAAPKAATVHHIRSKGRK